MNRQRAQQLGRRYYRGKVCVRGHERLRYTSNADCVTCVSVRRKTRWAKNPDAARAANWRQYGYPTPTRKRPDRCECCGSPPGKKALALDHCYESGAFRGWLCFRCNTGIGLLGDNIQGLRRAISYLRRAR